MSTKSAKAVTQDKNRYDHEDQISHFPHARGVYIFYDQDNEPIYVGKAIDLKKRASSYLALKDYKQAAIISGSKYVKYIVTSSELEAFILESNLIKKHSPKYNVLLCDDKSYPYLAIIYDSDFPRLAITRRTGIKNARYYGPYMAGALRQTMDLLRSVFQIATCKTPLRGRANGPCLFLHINRCLGPCAGQVDKTEYLEALKGLQLFLEGRHGKIIKLLKSSMRTASQKMEYEKAARIRDRLRSVENISESQKVVSKSIMSADFIGYAGKEGSAVAQVMSVRNKKLTGTNRFVLQNADDKAEAVRLFIARHYFDLAYIPKEICLPFNVPDTRLIEEMLSEKFGRGVKVTVPQKGERKSLIKMAQENALSGMEFELIRQAKANRKNLEALENLKEQLSLGSLPRRIECFDISNLSGEHAVGSMVVFEAGEARKNDYRHFKIKLRKIDDAKMIREVIKRRFSRILNVNPDNETAKADGSFKKIPELIVVDGGLVQASQAKRALEELSLSGIEVVGLAKKKEEIYRPFINSPVKLADNSAGKLLMQRIRDEAHRFALSYHTALRNRGMFNSVLETVPGIGEKRRQLLLKNFDSLEQIGQTDEEHLVSMGLPRGLAIRLIKRLKNYGARIGRQN
jgi:excinuclease ABC subunit C